MAILLNNKSFISVFFTFLKMGDPEYSFLRQGKKEDPADLRIKGTLLGLIGKTGQYGSLLLGVYAVTRTTPELGKAILGGIGYLAFSVPEYFGSLFGFRAEGVNLENGLDEWKSGISRQLDHIERKGKGRVDAAKILNPLDEIVAKDLEKEGITLDPKQASSGEGDTKKIKPQVSLDEFRRVHAEKKAEERKELAKLEKEILEKPGTQENQ